MLPCLRSSKGLDDGWINVTSREFSEQQLGDSMQRRTLGPPVLFCYVAVRDSTIVSPHLSQAGRSDARVLLHAEQVSNRRVEQQGQL